MRSFGYIDNKILSIMWLIFNPQTYSWFKLVSNLISSWSADRSLGKINVSKFGSSRFPDPSSSASSSSSACSSAASSAGSGLSSPSVSSSPSSSNCV